MFCKQTLSSTKSIKSALLGSLDGITLYPHLGNLCY